MHELAHLTDEVLLHRVRVLTGRDRALTASLLAHLAEVDARRLYLSLGHPSMFAYAVEALHFSESAAYRRIHAARAARRYPRLLAIVAEGRLHLAAVCLLAPHLTDENFDELVAAAAHRPKAFVEPWLARRFAPPLLVAAAEPAAEPGAQAGAARTPGDVLPPVPGELAAGAERGTVAQLVPGRVEPVVSARSAPALAPHVMLRLAVPESTHAKLRRAQGLLSHALPGGDLARVLDRVLDVFIAQAEKRKFAATHRPRAPRAAAGPTCARTIPARVKRAVRQRDQGRCAFVSAQGRRCSSRTRLEFDHVDPVARGGRPRIDRVRLLCRAHNQFEAERVYGRAFMERRRERERERARECERARGAACTTRPGTSCGAFEVPGSVAAADSTG